MKAMITLSHLVSRPACLVGGLLLATALPAAAQVVTQISLSSLDEVTAAFPSTFHQSTGSLLGFDAAKHLMLHAATDGAVSAATNAYSAQSYSNSLNFFSQGGLTVTFNDVGLSHTSAGVGYNLSLGIANNNTGSFSGSVVGQKVYFYVDRSNYTISLRQRAGTSAAQTLASWDLTSAAWTAAGGVSSVSLSSVSLTLTSTTWSATVKGATVSLGNQTKSGNLATALVQSDWTNKYYIGLQAATGATLADRIADGYIGSIEISSIPEPASASMLFGAGSLVLVGAARRRAR